MESELTGCRPSQVCEGLQEDGRQDCVDLRVVRGGQNGHFMDLCPPGAASCEMHLALSSKQAREEAQHPPSGRFPEEKLKRN